MAFSCVADSATLSELQLWKEPIDESRSQILGSTVVSLEGESSICRQFECNLGQFSPVQGNFVETNPCDFSLFGTSL